MKAKIIDAGHYSTGSEMGVMFVVVQAYDSTGTLFTTKHCIAITDFRADWADPETTKEKLMEIPEMETVELEKEIRKALKASERSERTERIYGFWEHLPFSLVK